MYKQSTYVIAMFLGTSQAFIETPESNSYFATGMNGDEDLGEDITMKGNKFHFIQQQQQNGCGANELSADGICLFKALAQEDPKTEKVEALEPEKVHSLDPKIAKSHTTFYNRDLIQLEGEGNGYPRPEQVHDLDPMVYTNISNMKNYSHVLNPSTGFRTAFYDKQNNNQVSDMQLLQETPALHPYNYDPWVYQFSRQNIRPYSGHVNDDPEKSRPLSQEETDALPANVARRAEWQKTLKGVADAKAAQSAAVDPMNVANENPEAKAAAEAADDKKLVDAALKKADAAAAAPKKEEAKAALAQTEAFYNHEAGLWMYDSTLIQGDDAAKEGDKAEEKPVGPTEKVQTLEPDAYQNRANTNKIFDKSVQRTTFYLGQNKK